MAKPLSEIENPIIHDKPVYRHPETVMYKPIPKCACGCGKWSADGFETENGEYLYSKECYYKLSIEQGWLKEVAV